MNTLELKNCLRWYSTRYTKLIVCAIDELPKKKLKNDINYGFVINLSKKSEMVSHWIGLFIERQRPGSQRRGSYMDSYAFRPRSFQLTDFISKNCTRVDYCGRQLQQLQSTVCGMYAACFIIHMTKGYSFKSFVDKFSKNLVINDQF